MIINVEGRGRSKMVGSRTKTFAQRLEEIAAMWPPPR